MNVSAIANRMTCAVNGNFVASLRTAIGYTKDATFAQVPNYAEPVAITVQVQALTIGETQQLDRMNINTARIAVYADVPLTPATRVDQTDADLVSFGYDPATPSHLHGQTWMVVAVTEQWPGWCRAVLVQQVMPC